MSSVHWMVATLLFTALLWLPYVMERLFAQGLKKALGNPPKGGPDAAPWARRAKAAHTNAVENVPVFAALVLAAAALDRAADPVVVLGAQVFFASRVLYTVVYIAGIPVARTLVFTAGWVAIIAMAISLLG